MEQLQAGERRIAAMVPTLYAAVDKRLWPAAARSVHAHLIHLVRTGRATTPGEPELDADYFAQTALTARH